MIRELSNQPELGFFSVKLLSSCRINLRVTFESSSTKGLADRNQDAEADIVSNKFSRAGSKELVSRCVCFP